LASLPFNNSPFLAGLYLTAPQYTAALQQIPK